MGIARVFQDTATPPSGAHRLANFLIRWTECLHGAGNLRDTLSLLADLSGARVVNLARLDLETDRLRTISCYDMEAQAGKRPLTRGMAPFILDGHGVYARPGAIWTLSEKSFAQSADLDPRSHAWLESRGFGEVVVITLGREGSDLDVIELYYTRPLSKGTAAQLDQLAHFSVGAWERRRKGYIARLLRSTPAISDRLVRPDMSSTSHPLSVENPYGLTAAEIRICTSLYAGEGVDEIARKTCVAKSTIRSHLRSIYAKTGVSGQLGLLQRLISFDRPATENRAGFVAGSNARAG